LAISMACSGCGKRDNNKRYNCRGIVMSALKLTQIGNSVGVILPKEVLARLKLEKGDTVFLTEAANGVTLTPYDPSLDEQLKLGREFMREYRDTFHQLAK
jgi:putative addiction module antidote